MINILFVCHGNICRSPMAEFILKALVNKLQLEEQFRIESAATSQEEIGNPIYPPVRRILSELKIDFSHKRARQISRNDTEEFDYIIAMDNKNIADLKSLGKTGGYIGRLSDFVPDGGWTDVPDPYYTGNFQEVYDLVTEGCAKLLAFIRNEQGI